MTLGEIIARIDELGDGLEIRAANPWTAETEALVVEPGRGGALGLFCTVRDAKEKLQHYVGDPPSMRLARVVAYAERLRADRESAATAARTFSVGGKTPAGYFEDVERPEVDGRYRFMAYRSPDHFLLATALDEGHPVRCMMTDGTSFLVVGMSRDVLELRDIRRGARVTDGPLRVITIRNPPPPPATGFELRDVLQAISLELLGTRWRLGGVDFEGESESLQAARRRTIELGGSDLHAISRNTPQITAGDFAGVRADGTPWVLVRIVRGMDYDVASRDSWVIDMMRDRFPHAEDVPVEVYFGETDFRSYFA